MDRPTRLALTPSSIACPDRRSPWSPAPWLTAILSLLALLATGCASTPAASEPAAEPAAAAAPAEKAEPAEASTPTAPPADTGSAATQPSLTAPAPPEATPTTTEGPCAGGVIKDDGGTELGYSFVPSSVEAFYLQRFERSEFRSNKLDAVCLCFFQKPGGSDANFEIVFHRDGGGGPQLEPYASVPVVATALGQGRADTKLYEFDVDGVEIPEGPVYIGARWNPSEEVRLYICADQSPETDKAQGFYKDDRQQGWRSVFRTADPTFTNHRSLLVRARAQNPAAED